MRKKLLISILGIVMLFSMFSLVIAQEEQGGQFSKQGALYFTSDGVVVNTLVYDTVKVGENITLYMTPYQLNGKTYDNSTISCRVGIVNPDGSRLYIVSQENFTVIGNNDIWTVVLPASFLYENGEYLFNWDCQDGNRGGYFNSHVKVTPTGEEFTISQAVLYGFLLLLLGLFLYIGLYGIRKAVSIEWLIGYICFSYVILYLIVSIIWILADNYLWSFEMLGNVLFIAWFIMGIGFLPFIIIVSLVILGKEAKAVLEQGYIKQGYSPEEARELSRKNKR